MTNDRTVKELDPGSLRALAHPLRVRLLSLLRTDGPATSAVLARRTSETTGATSYHLRQLARHGFVEEEHGRGTARERWWKASHRSTRWSSAPFLEDPATAAAANFLLRSQLELEVRLVQRWLGEQASWPTRWIEASNSSDWAMRLTADQLAEMAREVEAVMERYRAAEDSALQAERVMVFFRAFPTHEPPL